VSIVKTQCRHNRSKCVIKLLHSNDCPVSSSFEIPEATEHAMIGNASLLGVLAGLREAVLEYLSDRNARHPANSKEACMYGDVTYLI